MHYRVIGEGIPKVNVVVGFAQQAWYKKLTEKATSISQLEEMALVGAGMSLLWVPKNPLSVPVYGYQGKLGYSLLNALDPKAGGAMVEAIQKDGKSTWLDQIRNRFLHPTNPAQEAVNEPVNEPNDVDIEEPVEAAEQLEVRRKKGSDKSEGKEKGAEEKPAGTPCKRPSTLPFLDYVVVSDTLSGLGAEEKRGGSDPDDSATLTEMMRKKALEDKKRKLDEQAAAIFASKKARLQKETPPAPSESEIDFGVFTATRGNLLEKIYEASGSGGVKPVKVARRFDISQITPPTSLPSRTLGLSTPPEAPIEKETNSCGNGAGRRRWWWW
ncbi:hypothetical protein Hdeb2414_s0157g00817141 [Helianthus debilis subsp. tardiflorus]